MITTIAQVAESRVSFSITGFELLLLIAGGTLTLGLACFFIVLLWRNRESGSGNGGRNEQ